MENEEQFATIQKQIRITIIYKIWNQKIENFRLEYNFL